MTMQCCRHKDEEKLNFLNYCLNSLHGPFPFITRFSFFLLQYIIHLYLFIQVLRKNYWSILSHPKKEKNVLFCFWYINICWLCYIVICRFMQKESQRHNDKGRGKTSLENIYLSIYLQGSKGLCGVLMWEGVGDQTELQYIDLHSYGRQRCVFLVLQGCSTGGPVAQLSTGWWLSLLHLITNWSPKLHQGSRGPLRPGLAFPTTSCLRRLWSPTHQGPKGPLRRVFSTTSDQQLLWTPTHQASSARLSQPHLISNLYGPQLTDFLSLYNSLTPTQSPTSTLGMACLIVIRRK